MHEFKIGAVILASGMSKRMGEENKLLLSFCDKPLIEYPVEACINAKNNGTLHDFVVVTAYEEVVQIAKQNNVNYIMNENNFKGQSESIRLGVKHFYNLDAIAFLMGDMPFIKHSDIEFICSNFSGEILVPKQHNCPTNPVVFPKKYFDELLQLKGDIGGKYVIRKHNFNTINVNYNTNDIDTPSDLLKESCKN